MLSVPIVSLKILTRSFCNCFSYRKVLIMARGKELSNSQKALIIKCDGKIIKNPKTGIYFSHVGRRGGLALDPS